MAPKKKTEVEALRERMETLEKKLKALEVAYLGLANRLGVGGAGGLPNA